MSDIKTFMGEELNQEGKIEGAYPVLETEMGNIQKRIVDNMESYVYSQCMKLNIDPQVLEKQSKEIKRLSILAENRKAFIDWVFDKYPEVGKEYIGFVQ